MENYEAKQIAQKFIKHYRFLMLVIFLPLIIVYLYCVINDFSSVWFFLCIIVAYIIRRFVSTWLFHKYIYSILVEEMDPIKYEAVINAAKMQDRFAICYLYVSYYMGDYQTVINICTSQLRQKNKKYIKYQYMIYLARTYFETGQFNKLKELCEKFESEIDNKTTLVEKYPIMHYFALYVEGQFLECKKIYESILMDSKKIKYKLQLIQSKYVYAIACYQTGEIDKAKENFEYIIEVAPELNFAQLSQKYLDSIEEKREYSFDNQEIMVDENYQLPKMPKQRVIQKRIFMILFVLLAIACILEAFLFKKNIIDEPISFAEFNAESTRSDVRNLYGFPNNIQYYEEEGYLVENYKIDYLGEDTILSFRYNLSDKKISLIQWTLYSSYFDTLSEYKYAFDVVIEYYEELFKDYSSYESKTDENEDIIYWYPSETNDIYYVIYGEYTETDVEYMKCIYYPQ